MSTEKMNGFEEAQNLYNGSQFDNAIKKLNKILTNHPNDKEKCKVFQLKGNCLTAQGNLEEAIEQHINVLKIEPKDSTSLFQLGLIFRDVQKFEDSINAYKKILSFDSENQIVKINLAIVLNEYATFLKSQGKMKDSEEKYKDSLYYNPQHAHTYYNVSFVFF